MALSDKELDFAAAYIANGHNAYRAALEAGYSESTASHASDWIRALTKNDEKRRLKYKPELAAYIQSKLDPPRNSKIMSAVEKREILGEIARQRDNDPSDRIRAIDVDNKMTGEYNTKQDSESTDLTRAREILEGIPSAID